MNKRETGPVYNEAIVENQPEVTKDKLLIEAEELVKKSQIEISLLRKAGAEIIGDSDALPDERVLARRCVSMAEQAQRLFVAKTNQTLMQTLREKGRGFLKTSALIMGLAGSSEVLAQDEVAMDHLMPSVVSGEQAARREKQLPLQNIDGESKVVLRGQEGVLNSDPECVIYNTANESLLDGIYLKDPEKLATGRKNLESIIEQYPDHWTAAASLYQLGDAARQAGDVEQAAGYYKRLAADYPGTIYERGARQNAIESLSLAARRYLDQGNPNGALLVYQEGTANGRNQDFDQLIQSHVSALIKLPKNYSELNQNQRRVEEAIAYLKNNSDIQGMFRISAEIELVTEELAKEGKEPMPNNFVEMVKKIEQDPSLQEKMDEKCDALILAYIKRVRKVLDFDKLCLKIENQYQIKIDNDIPIIRIPREIPGSTIGLHINARSQAAPDTIQYEAWMLNAREADKESRLRIAQILVAHEYIHDKGYFETLPEIWPDRQHIEGVTDLLARRLYPGEKPIDIGYAREVANWANVCYLIGFAEGKDTKQCFSDGADLLGRSFLVDHSIDTIIDRVNQLLGNRPDTRPKLKKLFRSDRNNKYSEILTGTKTKDINKLAKKAGVDLTGNQENITFLGIGDKVRLESIGKSLPNAEKK